MYEKDIRYYFNIHNASHEEHIIIYSPLGRNIKGQEIIEVECTKEEISELVGLLDAVK